MKPTSYMPVNIARRQSFYRTMKFNLTIYKTLFLLICFIVASSGTLEAKAYPIILQDNTEINFTYTIRKSNGKPQTNVYAKIFGKFDKIEADEQGIIRFNYKPNNYNRTVNFYFKNHPDKIVKRFELNSENSNQTIYLDSTDDLLEYKRTGQTFTIEGMVQGPQGEPIERATVSIQGTGRVCLTDEIGLFKIEADFNHPVVIRADGMVNRTFPVTYFLQGDDKDYTINMYRKNPYELYSNVEKMPEFPGGMEAYKRYLDKNLEYPKKAKKAKIEGMVVVQFIVETNGEITNPQIVRHLETTLDSAAWRAIKDMPNWYPASDFGTAVRCKYSLPVAFKIPKPKPVLPADSMKLKKDSLKLDSMAIDSLAAISLRKDSILKKVMPTDSLTNDSIQKSLTPADSLQNDSTLNLKDADKTIVKAKKRNIFVRFFRWLFGIERRARKRAERAEKAELQNKESIIEITSDSVRIETDSIDLNLKEQKLKIGL